MSHYIKSTLNSVWYTVKYYHSYVPSAGDNTMTVTDMTHVLTDVGSCGNEPVRSLTPGSMKGRLPCCCALKYITALGEEACQLLLTITEWSGDAMEAPSREMETCSLRGC